MGSGLNSPLSGRVNSGFGGSGKFKHKIIFGTALLTSIPLVLSTFAASVTVGTGSLEFGQGSQQATACDQKIYVALGEEWKAAPTPQDSSAGFFRVRTVTVSNLDLQSCAGKKLNQRPTPRCRGIPPMGASFSTFTCIPFCKCFILNNFFFADSVCKCV